MTSQKNKKLKVVELKDFKSKARTEYKSKIEQRIDDLEDELKQSLKYAEAASEELLAQQKHQKELKDDLDRLTELFQHRIQESLAALIDRQSKHASKQELKLIQSLAGDLGKVFSLDFFKGLHKKLSSEDESYGEVDDFGMDMDFVKKVEPAINFLYKKYWRVETTGLENIPNNGRALIVGNHSGTLPYDGAMLAASIYYEHPVREDARFLVENFVYHFPFLGSCMYKMGGVRACPQNAQRLLENEKLVIVFPEGVKGIGKYFKKRYQLQRFGRGGFVKLCINTKSPLIPVGIVGAEEIHPIIFKSNMLAKLIGVPYIPITPTFPLMGLFGLIPLPSKWAIHFGKPLNFSKYKKMPDELTIHRLSENVRGEIQDILKELLEERKSIWLG